MAYDEVEIEDMKWNEKLEAFTYPCPCGDLFQISLVRRKTRGGRGDTPRRRPSWGWELCHTCWLGLHGRPPGRSPEGGQTCAHRCQAMSARRA